jgi:hypothetical protein
MHKMKMGNMKEERKKLSDSGASFRAASVSAAALEDVRNSEKEQQGHNAAMLSRIKARESRISDSESAIVKLKNSLEEFTEHARASSSNREQWKSRGLLGTSSSVEFAQIEKKNSLPEFSDHAKVERNNREIEPSETEPECPEWRLSYPSLTRPKKQK